MSGAGRILDIGASVTQVGIAMLLFHFCNGVWWAEIGIVLCLVTLPQRWIPAFQHFIADNNNGMTMLGLAIIEGSLLSLTVSGAFGFDSFQFRSLRHFEFPEFGLSAFGAFYYGFLVWCFYGSAQESVRQRDFRGFCLRAGIGYSSSDARQRLDAGIGVAGLQGVPA